MTLTSETFRTRLDRLTSLLDEQSSADALLLSDLTNVRWLTGLSSSNAAAVVMPRGLVVVTDSRYEAQAAASAAHKDVVVGRAVVATALEIAAADGITRLAVESESLSVAEFERLTAVAATDGIALVECSGWVESLRASKDAAEVAALSLACKASVTALAQLVDEVRIGMTEVAVARRLEALFAEFGGEDRAFASIVAAGPHSAIPHHEPTTRPLQFGDILKIDFGARVEGYHADCTRTFIVGAEPTELQVEIHAVVAEAATAARGALEPGIDIGAVDHAAREVLCAAGYEDRFTHGLGHGVGLAIHEAPIIAKGAAGTIPNGAVVTIEPGVYLPGVFGVRIEDTCHVTTAGVKILTDFPRELARIA